MKVKAKDPNELVFEIGNSENESPTKSELFFLGDNQQEAIEAEKLKSKKQDRKERKKYARQIFAFIWVWCAVIIIMLVLIGVGVLKFDTSVIITLISTTTANIVALFVIVANYLFYRQKK